MMLMPLLPPGKSVNALIVGEMVKLGDGITRATVVVLVMLPEVPLTLMA
jgi:hypothetical protein